MELADDQVALKVVPALLAGCTMVLKPSEFAPLSSALFAEIIDEAGVPAGVFNLIHGDGEDAGARLVAHPDVAMISFTGSTRGGAQGVKGAADTFKRVALELGGKGANLVFADADAEAVDRGVRGCFMQQRAELQCADADAGGTVVYDATRRDGARRVR